MSLSPAEEQSIDDRHWPATNRRRGALIHKSVAGTISESEAAELERLQELTDVRIDRVCPFDDGELTRLHRQICGEPTREERGE